MAKVKTISSVSLRITVAACIPLAIYEMIIDTEWYSILCTVAIAFVSVFFSSRYFFKQFVIYKIKPIYRLVTSKSISTRELVPRLSGSSDIMDEIRDELSCWSEKRANEIAQLKDSERFRKEYVGNVSHEIKTPIFTIQGYVQTLLEGAISDPEVNCLYLSRAAKSIERLASIITDLDEISKMESGEGELKMTVFDIKTLIKEVFAALEFEAEKYGIRLKIGPTATPRALVYADRGRVEQVLVNLVSNSIKYGKPGGTTTVNMINLYEEALIEVEDDGIGISEEHQKRLFERFYRVDKSRSREEGGTGLGLSIVKHIIEAHRTQLSVRSELGRGSVFSFTLQRPPKKTEES